ncbi:MAG TPA: prolyl oligopeptidase family serine peptidase [Methylibium sp.]|uniref:S9 family peptidase n=1 Tax=Methylibium sp. TaxID=2067992 RepID=UPI002DB9FC35|nr:prolyl oligopeptidase family serine peptidase [Methylibium sp.]HEU4457744.1 prolyl oligopeptidase family serine peptidase [Methylibium sp.]
MRPSLHRTTAFTPLLISALALAGCASTAPGTDVLEPNPNLVLQGIPPIPMSLVRTVERYTEFRGHGFVDWHPAREEMLVTHREAGASTPQLYRLGAALAMPERLTDGAEPVTEGRYEPRDGRYLVFTRSAGGNEAFQLHRLDLDTKATTPLTDPDQRHAFVAWLRGGGELIHTSVPLDRTAGAGGRSEPATTLWRIDPEKPAERRRVAELPGTGWFDGVVSRDDRWLALRRYVSINESEIWRIELTDGRATRLLPAAGTDAPRATHEPVDFSLDGRGLFVLSDRAGEFVELMRLDLAGGTLSRVTAGIPWDVSGAELSNDGRRLAAQVNADGRKELRLFDATTLAELPRPAVAAGSVGRFGFHRRSGTLAFDLDSVRSPASVHALDANAARSTPWTQPFMPAGIDVAGFQEQRIVRWKSFDGLALSAILNPPPARFKGRRPVLVSVHGGPEAQATAGFVGRWNYLVNELGFALLQPNVRGSAGYGKTFVALDNGYRREDSVKDLGSLLDWIAAQPDLDASRVVVYGGSYGGYMSLAASVHFADRIAGAIDVVGISNFVTFLANTESYRRDLRRVEYGDERDPAMRAFLERISPLANAGRITKPLFVVQGKNDPRVPWTEAEQIVARVRGQGGTVWYLRADNEGHGFRRKENADYQFYATLLFLQATALAPPRR